MSATTYTIGATYRVRVRNWDFTRNMHKPGNAVLRRYIGSEWRDFPGVTCHVFSARIRRNSAGHGGELSVPAYDLISATPLGGETAGSTPEDSRK